jgi:hypothetical protein
LRLDGEEVAIRAGHSEHVTEGAEDHVRLPGDRMRLVDHVEGRNADRASRAVDKLDSFGQEVIDSVFHNRMGLAAADFHNHPGAGLNSMQFVNQFTCHFSIAIFVQVFHDRSPSSSRALTS